MKNHSKKRQSKVQKPVNGVKTSPNTYVTAQKAQDTNQGQSKDSADTPSRLVVESNKNLKDAEERPSEATKASDAPLESAKTTEVTVTPQTTTSKYTKKTSDSHHQSTFEKAPKNFTASESVWIEAGNLSESHTKIPESEITTVFTPKSQPVKKEKTPSRPKVEAEIPQPVTSDVYKKHHLWRWVVGIILVLALGLGGWVVYRWIANDGQETSQNATEGGIDDAGNNADADAENVDNEIAKTDDDDNQTQDSETSTPEPNDSSQTTEAPTIETPATTQRPTTNPTEPEAPTRVDYSDGQKLVALTFDDGPSTATTPRLLDILHNNGVKATFFVLGRLARQAPDIVRREQAEGHEVGSHTMHHNQLTLLSFEQIRAEADEMNRVFQEILSRNTPFTRPPYGDMNETVKSALNQPLILWSVDPRDWQDRNAATVCSRVVEATRNGSVILVHDIHATTVDAVQCIIDGLKAQGYKFMTVSELAAARGVTLVNGVAYYSF